MGLSLTAAIRQSIAAVAAGLLLRRPAVACRCRLSTAGESRYPNKIHRYGQDVGPEVPSVDRQVTIPHVAPLFAAGMLSVYSLGVLVTLRERCVSSQSTNGTYPVRIFVILEQSVLTRPTASRAHDCAAQLCRYPKAPGFGAGRTVEPSREPASVRLC